MLCTVKRAFRLLLAASCALGPVAHGEANRPVAELHAWSQTLVELRYLLELGRTPGMEAVSRQAAAFDLPREPLRPAEWPRAAAAICTIQGDVWRVAGLDAGFRNPDGLALLPDGSLTVPVSEGEFTLASAICEVRQRAGRPPANPPPYFRGMPPALPLVYLPRGLDNSSGGQAYVSSDRWGPLAGQIVHFSFGACAYFLVLRDEVEGQPQGAVVPLVGDFRAGVHRGRFAPHDCQLYVSGMNGWQSYSVDDDCFQRVRYVGGLVQQPVRIRVRRNGVQLGFTAPLDGIVAGDATNHFAQCWNYRYGPAYGSAEFSPTHYGTPGHDPLTIKSATVSSVWQSLFLEIPDIQPVSQLHLHVAVSGGETRDIFATVHRLAVPFRDIPRYAERKQPLAAHLILRDLAMLEAAVPNPSRQAIPGARPITIEAGSNLSFKTAEFRVAPGEPIALTFANPDVVPHNGVLVKPGALAKVGGLADTMITDPQAVARHDVPASKDVLAYADVTHPAGRQTTFFITPTEKGRYPFLCTFPGHWKLMNGAMVVGDVAETARQLFRRDNLVAWCIVPFDAKKRGPAERAEMLAAMGFKRFAYDWRTEHVPSFDREWEELTRRGIELHAFWSTPPDLPKLMGSFQERALKPSFWVMIHAPAELDQDGKVRHAAESIRPLCEAAARAGCRVSI